MTELQRAGREERGGGCVIHITGQHDQVIQEQADEQAVPVVMSAEVTSASIATDYHNEKSPLDSEEDDDRGRDSVEMNVPQLYVSESMKHNSLPMIFKLDCKRPLGISEDDRTLIATPPLALSSPNGLDSEESSESDSETVSRDHSANDTVSRDTLDEDQEELSEDGTDKEEVVKRRNRPFDRLDLTEDDKKARIREDLLIPSPMFMRKLSDRRSKVLEAMGTLPSILVPPEEADEDDVFRCDEQGDKNRSEKKLVDWALNVYVPACRTLLQRCGAKKVDAKKVLSDLRNLSNTVNFFCTEHQKQNEIRSTHGISPSHSSVVGMDVPRSHNTSPILPRSRLLPSPVPVSLSPTPQESEASVAVKVLRSVSSSLLHPLLEGADNGFTKDFYRDIIIAIQKISWKVEACLTYNNQGEEYDVHKRIFDVKQTALVGSMMTALPPAEPSFHTSPVHFVRGGKRSSKRTWLLRTNTDPEKEEETDLASSANTRDSALEDTTHDPFASGDRNFERRSGDSSSLSEDFHTREPGSPPTSGVESDMDYFRHTRRTTISLSKREVKSLGLHLIKPVDTSSRHHRSNTMGAVNMMRLHMMNQVADDEPVNLRRVRDKVKAKIAKDFPEMDAERCGTPTERLARLSDMREGSEEEASKVTNSVEGSMDLLSHTTTEPPLQIRQQPSLSPGRSSLISDMSLDPDYILVERPPSSASRNRGRIKSLELDHLLDTTLPPQTKPERAMTPSCVDSRDHYAASTMPHKRKSVFSKLVKKKGPSKSFGRGDTIGRRRRNIRTRSTTLFNEDEDQKEPLFLESIEKFSRNVLPKNVPLEREESTQLVLTVELVSSKVSRPHQKRKSSITADFLSSSLLLEITVCSDIPELIRQGEYKILRTQKDLITLYDTLEEYSITHLSPGAKGSLKFPDRPDKKKLAHKKERRQNAEELLRFFARRPELRTCDAFLEFLRPDDMFSTLQHKDSESFDLLMTFYTPLEYTSGSPGSRHEVAVIGRGDITAHTPTTPLRKGTSKKYAALSEGSSLVQVARVPGAEEDDVTLMIKEEGVPVLVVLEDDSSHMVMAGRFEKLVEQLACQKKPDPRYVSTFLLGYRHFSTSEDLLTLLIRRFQMTVPPNASEAEMAYAEKWRYVIQLRVLDVLLFWMRTCWEDFHRNINMLEKLRQFISELQAAEDANFKVAGISMDTLVDEKLNLLTKRGLPSPAHSIQSLQSSSQSLRSTGSPSHSHKNTPSPAHTTATPTTPSTSSFARSLSSGGAATTNGHRRRPSVDISSLTAIQLSRQLTLIELDFLKSIDVYELAVYLWESNNQNNKPYRRNLDAYITRFNKVSYWVASEICSMDDVRMRGTLIEKFIEVAKHCLEYKNFNTLVSVVTGISLSAVRRLKKSWEHVNEKSVKSFQKLKELTNPVRSHAMYRKTLAAVSPRCNGCIPYFGVFMRDVTLFNEGNPKRLRNGLLNFSKLRTLVAMFEELKHFQRSKYYFPSDDRTRQYCIELVCLSEQDLYDTSLALEPREAEQSNT